MFVLVGGDAGLADAQTGCELIWDLHEERELKCQLQEAVKEIA